jgi:hypothetical protein
MFKVIGIFCFCLLIQACEFLDSQNSKPIFNEKNGGDWSGGGGDIFTPHLNPWFLDNVDRVYYCINTYENFNIETEKLEQLISSAIGYWKNEFELAQTMKSVYPLYIPLATQDFVRTECNGSEDVHFSFGGLSQEQTSFLPNYENFIGYAGRTSYDPVQMKAKGFVYIADQKKMNEVLDIPVALDYSKNDYHLLELLLIHETGHLFGMTKSSHYLMKPLTWLFQEPIPASVPGKRFRSGLHLDYKEGAQFLIDCTFSRVIFDIEENECLKIEWVTEQSYQDFSRSIKSFDLYVTDIDTHQVKRILGKAQKMENGFVSIEEHHEMGIFFPKEQKVYNAPRINFTNNMIWMSFFQSYRLELENTAKMLSLTYKGSGLHLGVYGPNGVLNPSAIKFDFSNPIGTKNYR